VGGFASGSYFPTAAPPLPPTSLFSHDIHLPDSVEEIEPAQAAGLGPLGS
jgi:hypothetical protein